MRISEAGSQPPRVAVLTPEAGGYYAGDVLRGIDERLAASGVQALVVQTAVSWQATIREHPPIDTYLRLGSAHRRGVIAISATMAPHQLAALAGLGEPVVTVAGAPARVGGASVVVDNVGGAAEAVRHLAGHGHRRIGFVGALIDHDVVERLEGYRLGLEQAGIEVDERLCFAVNDDLPAGGREGAEAILDAGMPLSAVFAATDTHAVALMGRLREAGIRTPDDIAIVGFDDSESAQTAVPALTSVRQLPGLLGSAGAEAFLRLAAGAPPPAGPLVLPTALVRRHSCGCFDARPDLLDAADDWTRPDWQSRLADVLERALVVPPEPEPGAEDVGRIWPGVNVVIESFDHAVRGEGVADVAELDEAWRAASLRTRNAETLLGLVDLLEFVGLCRQPGAGSDPDALRPRLRAFLAQARLQLLRYTAIADPRRHPEAPRVAGNLVRSFLDNQGPTLGWLRIADAVSGCLGLWEPGEPGAAPGHDRLRIAEVYGASPPDLVGTSVALEEFPPAAWLDADGSPGSPASVTVAPVVTPRREWGLLAAVLPAEHRYYDGHWELQQGTALLALALDNAGQRR